MPGTPGGAPSLRFRVPVLPLETILRQNGIRGLIRLLKIDVEGFELPVLSGINGAAGQIEHIVVELLTAAALHAGQSLPALDLLSALGFTRWRTVEGAAWLPGRSLPENNLWASRPAPST